MTVRTRFAPSPTGRLHLGNLRTAVLCWLYAKADKSSSGAFVLRLDDTDAERSTDAFADAIKQDLQWLGLVPDETFCQSERLAQYEAAFTRLKDNAHIYPCYETPEELEEKRARQLARRLPPIYDRAALRLTDEQKTQHEKDGRKPHWRLRLSGEVATWDDMVRGAQKIATTNLSDPVLRRADGAFLYTLPSVVDDAEARISHVIRGEDHVTNTAVQLELAARLEVAPPSYGHHTLLVGEDGAALSKRKSDASLAQIQEDGFEPQAVVAYLGQLGFEDTASGFDLTSMGRSALRLDMAELTRTNARHLQSLSYAEAQPRLAALACDGGEAFWQAAKGNITRLQELVPLHAILTDQCEPQYAPADEEFLRAAAQSLPAEPWDDATWGAWTSALAAASGRKGKALFLPLRLALTGMAEGPAMRALLPLIGRARAAQRLDAKKSP